MFSAEHPRPPVLYAGPDDHPAIRLIFNSLRIADKAKGHLYGQPFALSAILKRQPLSNSTTIPDQTIHTSIIVSFLVNNCQYMRNRHAVETTDLY